jgi:ppGpp synthetase/RelA/SpoT-type nucleotidyltranferase
VHVIANLDGKPVEIQIRTEFQHLWAELSEKLSDVVDPAIKYGGGPREMRKLLGTASRILAKGEAAETRLLREIEKSRRELEKSKARVAGIMGKVISSIKRSE